ncbi:hypothetical protein B0T24DRAFT_623097 [Lasiosphaeria ovina]|uniref:Secreted protein n=1 Tax=Lasiosphaeria ovina TaxID=92902 RepID=A0AAE0N7B6_9PEZI|nr:hypothetical protein B0T24DRAFT_623097 [Lasiosphaeria ovina]
MMMVFFFFASYTGSFLLSAPHKPALYIEKRTVDSIQHAACSAALHASSSRRRREWQPLRTTSMLQVTMTWTKSAPRSHS